MKRTTRVTSEARYLRLREILRRSRAGELTERKQPDAPPRRKRRLCRLLWRELNQVR